MGAFWKAFKSGFWGSFSFTRRWVRFSMLAALIVVVLVDWLGFHR